MPDASWKVGVVAWCVRCLSLRNGRAGATAHSQTEAPHSTPQSRKKCQTTAHSLTHSLKCCSHTQCSTHKTAQHETPTCARCSCFSRTLCPSPGRLFGPLVSRRPCLETLRTMTAQPSWTSTSQDTIFLTYIEGVPVPLRDAMYQKKLVDPGLLKASPRDTAENLGLVTSGRTATLGGGSDIGDGISMLAVGAPILLTLALPPTSSPTLQHTGEQSTTHRDARPITDTTVSTTTPPHAPVIPEVGVRRKRVGKLLSVNTLRGESSSLVKPMTVPS